MQLARELSERGHAISHVSVGLLLKNMGYSLQGNRKTLEGASRTNCLFGSVITSDLPWYAKGVTRTAPFR